MYLDTVFLLGSIAATHGDARGWFAVGALVAVVMMAIAVSLVVP